MAEKGEMENGAWHARDYREVLNHFAVDPETGLDPAPAEERLLR